MYRMKLKKGLVKDHLQSRQAPTDAPGTPTTIFPSSTPLPPSTVGPPSSHQNADHETTIVAITAASLALIIGFIFAFYILKHCYEKRKLAGHTSKNFFRLLWSNSSSDSQSYRIPGANEQHEPIVRRNLERGPTDVGNLEMAYRFDRSDRAASFRSVITLPSYIQDARQNEQVLGREGERGGIDIVVEFPHSAVEEEQQREEEMEALYQVRLARRRENEARERRRIRREQGDNSAQRGSEENEEQRDRDVITGQSLEELRAEHDRLKRQRQRAVSVVSYAEIGVARHDGTRLNSASQEIEQSDFLDDAASTVASAQPHIRNRPGSIRSLFTMGSDFPSTSPQNSNIRNSLSFTPRQISTTSNVSPIHPLSAGYMPASPFTTQIWDTSRVSSRGASELGNRSASLRRESSGNIMVTSPIPSSVPPEYGAVPLESPINTTELPPDYSSPETEETSQSSRLINQNQSNLDDSENGGPSSSSAPATSESNEQIPHSRSDSVSSELHVRRSSRGKLPPLSNLKLRPLPSIQVYPASPPPIDHTIDNELHARLEQ